MSGDETICPECGAPIAAGAVRGLCPRCLVAKTFAGNPNDVEGAFALRTLEEVNALFPDFEIRQLLGRGGMGAVYDAWQKSLARSVALKILPPELLRSRDFFDRFQREARMMAKMDHPNVARVYESGVTREAEVYIVMERIMGEPITVHAARKKLTIPERLELFIQVCRGVQHAHQKGIIHRDLKPSNILVAEVEGRATPKVIDFGLAKPFEQAPGDEALWLSSSHAMGTPAYMSPEQAAGNDIDARSDIYSLGALLYELMTGQTLFEDKSLGLAAPSVIARTIGQTPAPRPSQRLERIGGRQRLARELRGDLDAIVLKALDKIPARRYETASALARDVQFQLAHQPVSAAPATASYLFGKFCRRHRAGLAVTAALLALLLAGFGLAARESLVAWRAERLAADHLRQGERLIEFMLDDLQTNLSTVGRLDILESALVEIKKFYAQPGPVQDSPESLRNRACASLQLGWIDNSQGKGDLAEAQYRESIRLYRAALARQPDREQWRKELGRAWNSLAVFHHARGEMPAAEIAYHQALGIGDRLLTVDSANADWADFKASVLHNLAALCEACGRLDEAEQQYQQALRLWRPLARRTPDDPRLLEHLAQLYQSLAFLQGRRSQWNAVEQSNAEALRLGQRWLGLDTNNVRAIAMLADIQQNISEARLRRGDLVAAEFWMSRYRPIREQLAARDSDNSEWRHLLADSWRSYAELQTQLGHLNRAAEAHRKAWEISEKDLPIVKGEGTAWSHWRDGLQAAAQVFARLAERESKLGHAAAAKQRLETLDQIHAKLARGSPRAAE